MSKQALAPHLGFWLRLVSSAASRSFAARLESADIGGAEWAALRELYESGAPVSPSTIADLTGMTRGAVSKLVDRLLDKGFVTRVASAGDRRFQELELTPKARALMPRLGALADENDADFFAALSEAERTRLAAALQKLARAHGLTSRVG